MDFSHCQLSLNSKSLVLLSLLNKLDCIFIYSINIFTLYILFQIREKLANEKQNRENAEKAKKIRRMKQFGKKVNGIFFQINLIIYTIEKSIKSLVYVFNTIGLSHEYCLELFYESQ